ncbi:MAG: HDOD domain-containing protein [Nitrosomonadales bacterium]
MSVHLKKFTFTHIGLLAIVIAVVITCVVGGAGILLKGEKSYDYFLMGFEASLLVDGLIIIYWYFIPAKQINFGEEPHNDVTAIKIPENLLTAGNTQKHEVVKNTYSFGTQLDFTQHKATEVKIRNDKGQADIKRAINNLDALPAMPVIAQRLLALKLDSEDGQRMLLQLIEQDPQISAKILGLANSAIVGASRRINTVKDASMMLGLKRVQSVAVSIAIISLMTKPSSSELNMQDLWMHSFGVAFAMRSLARIMPTNMRPPDDLLFLSGMLHDIGYLALAFLDPSQSDRLHNRLAAEPDRPSLEIEQEILEFCHDELGAELARHWNLPDEIIAVLRYHHTPDAIEAAAGQPLVRMVHIVEKLLPSFGIIEYVLPDIKSEEWEALGIDPAKAEEVKKQVAEQAEEAVQFAKSFN